MKYLLILFGLLSVLAEEVQLPEVSPSEEYNEYLEEHIHLKGNSFFAALFELREKLKAKGGKDDILVLVLNQFIEDYASKKTNRAKWSLFYRLQTLLTNMEVVPKDQYPNAALMELREKLEAERPLSIFTEDIFMLVLNQFIKYYASDETNRAKPPLFYRLQTLLNDIEELFNRSVQKGRLEDPNKQTVEV